MAKIRKSVRIHAPVSAVYAYLTDPRHLPSIWPSMEQVSEVKTSPDGAHSFHWVYRMAGMHLEGHGETSEVIPEKKVVLENKSGVFSKFVYLYRQEGEETVVDMEVTYEVPVPLLGKLAEAVIIKMNDGDVETLLENLKAKMEEKTAD